MESFDDVKKFYDYLIIDDDGWKGVREDAPDDVKKAYDDYIKNQNELAAEGIKS